MPQRSFPSGLSAQTLFDALPAPCLLLTLSGQTQAWNAAFERLSAREPGLAQRCETAIGQSVGKPVTIQTGRELYHLQTEDLPDASGQLISLRLAESGERQLEALRTLGASAGHDLQEPVRKMLAFSGLLQRRYGDQLDADGVQSLEFMSDAAQRMRALINDVLAYIDVATRPLKPEPVSLGIVLTEVVKARSEAVAAAEAVIEPGDLPVVSGDSVLLRQMFEALLDNALKFRRGTGVRISIAATRQDDHYRIEMRDDGIGVDPALAEKLFTPFGRLHPRETYPGAALGLALSRLILERHGGAIWLEPGAGEGACFVFTLPASD